MMTFFQELVNDVAFFYLDLLTFAVFCKILDNRRLLVISVCIKTVFPPIKSDSF